MTILAIPFATDIGYPQQTRFRIGTAAYIAYLRRVHPTGEFEAYTTIRLVRISDRAVILTAKLAELTPLEIRDPTTRALITTLYPFRLSAADCEIWVFT